MICYELYVTLITSEHQGIVDEVTDTQQIQCIASTKHCSWTFLHQWAITSIFGHFFTEHVQKLLFPELLVKILTLPLDSVTLTSRKRALKVKVKVNVDLYRASS